MKIKLNLLKEILIKLDEHPSNLIYVSHLATEVNHNKGNGDLSDDFTNHLLHLQDLSCFFNDEGKSTFGHKVLTDDEFTFSHCYEDQYIRINSNGRELLDVLNSDISNEIKDSAIRFGGKFVTDMLIHVAKTSF